MRVYIVRHGKAAPSEIDPQHSLSELGRLQVQQLANFLSKKRLTVSRIYHSGLLRAQQTAEILAAVVESTHGVEENTDLLPEKPVNILAMDLAVASGDVMLVGHLPLLNKLVSELVLGNEEYTLVNFFPGTLVCLERVDNRWVIDWMLATEILNE
jgi:phosphohistidine phosphatase